MTDFLGPNTRGVLHLLSSLDQLDVGQVEAVAAHRRRQSPRARASAWAAIGQAMTPRERLATLGAAALARQKAIDVANRSHTADWAFWAATWDAAIAVALCGRVDADHYETLVGPVAHALPWITHDIPLQVQVASPHAALARVGAPHG
ncbi:hypothetical protein [Thermasporomyces composti]|jgi:hypothetical protein|uniref:Uncharacterized protein n=1 Tax=Thermasporomyces composti TaxID=696763 RepID=A0A3D9V7R8_THECX|nr:hypothetical protein [Thermasporomyces composti]REF37557.1 hypothetical protein DFJ64_3001 [Thermasporomyces composti]